VGKASATSEHTASRDQNRTTSLMIASGIISGR
jgi:hypothetical protein